MSVLISHTQGNFPKKLPWEVVKKSVKVMHQPKEEIILKFQIMLH